MLLSTPAAVEEREENECPSSCIAVNGTHMSGLPMIVRIPIYNLKTILHIH